MKRITIQGIAGCFHETAAHGSFPGEEVEVLPCVSFDEQFARMAADAELLGVAPCDNWDGQSYAAAVTGNADCGRDHLVLSQMAHVCQRSARCWWQRPAPNLHGQW